MAVRSRVLPMFDVFEPAWGLHVTEIGRFPNRIYAGSCWPEPVVDVQGRGHGVIPDEVVYLQLSGFDFSLSNLLLGGPNERIQLGMVRPIAIG